MNWENINLSSGYERDQNIIDPLTFDTLLLGIHCNVPSINIHTVREQFEIDLQSRIDSAREVFENNLENIVLKAIEERNKP